MFRTIFGPAAVTSLSLLVTLRLPGNQKRLQKVTALAQEIIQQIKVVSISSSNSRQEKHISKNLKPMYNTGFPLKKVSSPSPSPELTLTTSPGFWHHLGLWSSSRATEDCNRRLRSSLLHVIGKLTSTRKIDWFPLSHNLIVNTAPLTDHCGSLSAIFCDLV